MHATAKTAHIEKLRVLEILDMLPSLRNDSINRIIAEAQIVLYVRADEEQTQQEYDAMCMRDDMLYGGNPRSRREL